MQQEQIKALIVNIITAAIILGVLVAVYFVFVKKNVPVVGTTVSSVAEVAKIAEETALIGTEIDYTVRDLGDLARAVESSNAIFDLPAFKSLQDFTVPIWGEQVGRVNPFIPTEWKLRLNALGGKIENIPVETVKEPAKKEGVTPSVSTTPDVTSPVSTPVTTPVTVTTPATTPTVSVPTTTTTPSTFPTPPPVSL